MHVLWFIAIILYQFRQSHSWIFPPPEEVYHYPGGYTEGPSLYINGTDTMVSSRDDTPDYRVEESMYTVRFYNFRHENERPYRNSPPRKQTQYTFTTYWNYWNAVEMSMGCYCNTVYRKSVLIAGCAVITTKHILTTATSTVLILRSYGHLPHLERIVGGWYDTDLNSFNASFYFTPSRMHIHEKYVYDYEVNVSHPIPAMFDLSVWSSTYRFYLWGEFVPKQPWLIYQIRSVIICTRAASGSWEYTSSIPRKGDMSIVAGFQFMKAYKRRPLPWYRYIIKTHNHVWPCPKTEWHWFHCVAGEYWGKYGFDSGGGMTGAYRNQGWRRDGTIGLCSFSLKLRAKQTVHYFTVVDTHPVLDFLYDSILGLKKYAYLDSRFEDTKWGSPQPYYGSYVPYYYSAGYEAYGGFFTDLPYYRR